VVAQKNYNEVLDRMVNNEQF